MTEERRKLYARNNSTIHELLYVRDNTKYDDKTLCTILPQKIIVTNLRGDFVGLS